MTAGQRLIEQGRQQGFQQGIEEVRLRVQKMLLRLQQERCGHSVDRRVEERLAAASFEQLLAWLPRALSGSTPTR